MATKRDVVQISSYSRRLKENIKSIMDNYGEILKTSKVTASEGQNSEYDSNIYRIENEIEIRAANMVRAAEALSHLVTELKEYLILHDFSSINNTITSKGIELERNQKTLVQDTQQLFDNYKERQLQAFDDDNNNNN